MAIVYDVAHHVYCSSQILIPVAGGGLFSLRWVVLLWVCGLVPLQCFRVLLAVLTFVILGVPAFVVPTALFLCHPERA